MAGKAKNDFDPEAMDAAGKDAEKEFKKLKTASQVAAWVAKWYMKAGYRRLGRIMVKAAKE